MDRLSVEDEARMSRLAEEVVFGSDPGGPSTPPFGPTAVKVLEVREQLRSAGVPALEVRLYELLVVPELVREWPPSQVAAWVMGRLGRVPG